MKHHDQLSFADQERASRQRGVSRATTRLRAIAQFVNWGALEALLPGKDKRTEAARRAGGRPRYPEKMMIRLIMLQYLYDLSDAELEEQVIDRSSFQEFALLDTQHTIPDFTTIWRFKEELATHGTLTKLFTQLQTDLEQRGLILKQGTIIDATVIPTTFSDPLKQAEREALLETEAQTGRKHRYLDSEARSTSKIDSKGRPRFFYGYKGHIAVDLGSKLIRRFSMSSANRQDIEYYPELITAEDHTIYGDKGYQKADYRREAEQAGRTYNVMRKADKYHPLSEADKAFNRTITPHRGQVEHVFAYMKTKLSLARTRARGLLRNRLRLEMNAILYNIERSLYLLKVKSA
jgi:IS5 family transposase